MIFFFFFFEILLYEQLSNKVKKGTARLAETNETKEKVGVKLFLLLLCENFVLVLQGAARAERIGLAQIRLTRPWPPARFVRAGFTARPPPCFLDSLRQRRLNSAHTHTDTQTQTDTHTPKKPSLWFSARLSAPQVSVRKKTHRWPKGLRSDSARGNYSVVYTRLDHNLFLSPSPSEIRAGFSLIIGVSYCIESH